MSWVDAAAVTEVARGQGTIVTVKGREVALFNIDGTVHAVTNVCPHAGGPVGEGLLEGKVITCPWHGWQYDVTTGECLTNPDVGLRRFRISVDGQRVKISEEDLSQDD